MAPVIAKVIEVEKALPAGKSGGQGDLALVFKRGREEEQPGLLFGKPRKESGKFLVCRGQVVILLV